MTGRTNAAVGGAEVVIESQPMYNGVEYSPWTITTERPIKQLIFLTQIAGTNQANGVVFYPYSQNGSIVTDKAFLSKQSFIYLADISVSDNKIVLTWDGGFLGVMNFNITVGYIPA